VIKKLLKKIFFKLGPQCRRIMPPANPIHLWDDDQRFNVIFSEIYDRTLVDKPRCYILYQLAGHAHSVPGDAAEIGVFRGGTAKLLSKVLSDKKLHLFDTFSGMPPTDKTRDMHKQGDFSDTSLEDVKAFLKGQDNISLYPGFFPATAAPIEHLKFSMVHIDVDIYQSVIDCCKFFYPRIQRGGIMVFDDYGFTSCPGARAAVDEFFSDKPEKAVYLPTGQSAAIKI
jgi:O-methyltransferase